MATRDVTPDRLKELFHYAPETGVITWKVNRRRARSGNIATRPFSLGYLSVSCDYCNVLAHRVAWMIYYGTVPDVIDHINGIKTDNRIENLRNVTTSINGQNQRKAMPQNKTGLLGVHYEASRNKYRASIKADGKIIRLGRFETAEEAHAVYLEAKRRLHVGCTI